MELLLAIIVVLYAAKNATADVAYAVHGKNPPRTEVRLAKMQGGGKAGTSANTRPRRYGALDYLTDLWADSWEDARETRVGRRVARKADPETSVEPAAEPENTPDAPQAAAVADPLRPQPTTEATDASPTSANPPESGANSGQDSVGVGRQLVDAVKSAAAQQNPNELGPGGLPSHDAAADLVRSRIAKAKQDNPSPPEVPEPLQPKPETQDHPLPSPTSENSAVPRADAPMASVTPIRSSPQEDISMTIPTTSASTEIVSLASAKSYTEQMAATAASMAASVDQLLAYQGRINDMAGAAQQMVASVDQSIASLAGAEVSGDAIAQLAMAKDTAAQLSQKLSAAAQGLAGLSGALETAGILTSQFQGSHAALTRQDTVAEAYTAVPEAGNQQFLTQGQ